MITDLNYLKTMSGGDDRFIAEMIGLFREQIDEYNDAMPRLVRDQDHQNLSRMAHKAKSSVAVMGMTSTSELLKELELLARDGKETGRYEGLVEEFLQNARQAIEELEKLTGGVHD